MKRIVICMDGTWQNLAWQARDFDPVTGLPVDRRTNVAKIAQLTLPEDDGVKQLVYYSPGVGARTYFQRDKRMKYDGATGEGAEENMIAAYMFLSFNYEPGDEIYMFGFSRGAFSVRSLAGLVARCGVLKRGDTAQVRNAIDLYRRATDSETDRMALEFRNAYASARVAGQDGAAPDYPNATRINFIGVFDTVVMRKSIPELISLKEQDPAFRFHNLKLGAHVLGARHAMALDERRNTLPVTPWTNLSDFCRARGANPCAPEAPYQQKWFSGAHGDVGGGQSRELSEVSRKWVLRGAVASGLKVSERLALDGEPNDPLYLKGQVEVIKSLWYLGYADRTVFPEPIDPGERVTPRERVEATLDTIDQHMHVTCINRMLTYKAGPNRYRPNPVHRAFKKLINPEDRNFANWREQRTSDLWM